MLSTLQSATMRKYGFSCGRMLILLIAASSLLFTHSIKAQWVQTVSFSGSVQALAVSGTNIFAGIWFPGVYLSTDNGATWTEVNSGLTDTDIFALVVSGTNLFAGAESGGGTEQGGVFLSTNNGTTWTSVSTGLTDPDVMSLAVSGANLFAGTWGGGAFLSTNNGGNWTAINSGLTHPVVYAFGINGVNIFAGTGGGGVFLSTNNGASWTAVNSGLTNLDVRSFAFIGSNIFAATYGGGVFLSTNNGTSWTTVNTGLTYPGVLSFAVSDANLFAGTACGGVFLSTDNGTSWTDVNEGDLTSQCVYSLTVKDSNLFAGTYQGYVWRRPLSEMIVPVELTNFTAKTNGADVILDWSTATELNNSGFEVQKKSGSEEWYSIGFIQGSGTTQQSHNYTFTNYSISPGIYSYRLKQIDFDGSFEFSPEVEVEVSAPKEFTLEQNYPNPFNPGTKINFSLAVDSKVTLKVFDILGQEVVTLLNDNLEAGLHNVDFDAASLNSGVYFYRIEAAGSDGSSFAAVKKMILLR